MRIGIDVDGVLRDFITAFKSVVGQEYPNAKIPESISTWKFLIVLRNSFGVS